MSRLAEFGWGGDSHPASQPQYEEDHDLAPMHDEPNYEPGSAEYNVFYGNGQLHVSPHHEHDELREHAGVPGDHNGPIAVGSVSVDRGRATWSIEGNVALRGLARVFKEYTKQVGWQWGGLTDLNHEPIDDEFAPKKTMYIRDNQTGEKRAFIVQGMTAYLTLNEPPEFRMVLKEAGYKVADVPGGGNMMDRMKVHDPMGESLEIYDRGTLDKNDPDKLPDEDTPTGTFKCPKCSEIFPNWSEYMEHRRTEDPMSTELPTEDGKFPNIDLDKTLPAHHHDHNPVIMPLATWKEAARVEGFDLYAGLWGYDTDAGHRHYGAFMDGQPVGYASVREIEGGDKAEVLMVYSRIHGRGIGEALAAALKIHYRELVTHTASSQGERLARKLGMVNVGKQMWKWAAGQMPKDMIDSPVPFVYDIDKDLIAIGHPGERTSDIPGEFTPGGIVEGVYNPGGKVEIHTMTNMPYTVRHMIDLWYWSHPQMEVTGVELEDSAGGKTKLAKISRTDVGTYIKTLAVTDPAVWNAYQALRKAGGKVYVVGGAIRDALLQHEPKDIDLLVAGVPSERVAHELENLPGRVDLTGKSFGVYRYKTKGHEVEIALPRTERSTGDRRVDFDVSVDHDLPVDADLLRRDFTANAMAVDLDSGALVDPYGGADDIAGRVLRTTHPDSFKEDPTRLLRALIMHGRYGFHPDERTRQEIAEHADRLPLESHDAKQPILDKILKSANPAAAIRLAHDTGLLKHIFPEVENSFDFDQNNPHHRYTLGEHHLNVLDNISQESSDPDLRLAALLHDIGKPASAWTNPETGFNHYYRGPEGQGDDHAIVGSRLADSRLTELRWPKARRDRITHLINHHMFPAFSGSRGARKFLHRVGDEHGDDLLTLRWADQHGKGQTPEEIAARTSVDQQRGLVEQVRSKQQPTSISALNISGNDILAMGVKPGPQVGRILRLLTDDVIEDPNLNDPEALRARAQEYVNALPVA